MVYESLAFKLMGVWQEWEGYCNETMEMVIVAQAITNEYADSTHAKWHSVMEKKYTEEKNIIEK